jgi:polysaccharide export outer membrane protein
MLYLQNMVALDSASMHINENNKYKITSGDVLYVKVLSINENMNKLFNIESGTNVNYGYNEANMYINGYMISDSGYVCLPIIGNVQVEGNTIEEVQRILSEKVVEYIKDAIVIVKLTNFQVTILGEVGRPGVYTNYDKNLNLFEALGKAGDLTDYGNRSNLLIVRQTKTGSQSFRANLLDKAILTSEFFYLHPNDVIYVEPVRTKAWKMNTPNVSIILSSLTTMIVILNFITR